jgi:hypothetical protein
MPTNLDQGAGQGSAKIYQFPRGGRASVDGQRRDASRLNADFSERVYVEAASFGSWYHEEAIREAQQKQPKKSVVVPLPFPHH